MPPTALKLVLGPLLYYWPRAAVFEYYEAVAKWPVDGVYLGETVCSRRHELRLDDWIAIGETLTAAGKEVVLSTFELIESDADLRAMHAVVDNARFLVEANDMAAVHRLAGRRPFIAGPFLNVYNAGTLKLLADLGATRWVPPIELSGTGIAAVLAEARAGIETEIFAYGHLPLAVSARCFTARNHNVVKDRCEFRCIEYPDGILVETRDAQPFLVLNGVQTQSAHVHNLLPVLAEVSTAGADLLRLSPQRKGMSEVVAAFRGAVDGSLELPVATARLAQALPAAACDGYWYGRPGMIRVSAP